MAPHWSSVLLNRTEQHKTAEIESHDCQDTRDPTGSLINIYNKSLHDHWKVSTFFNSIHFSPMCIHVWRIFSWFCLQKQRGNATIWLLLYVVFFIVLLASVIVDFGNSNLSSLQSYDTWDNISSGNVPITISVFANTTVADSSTMTPVYQGPVAFFAVFGVVILIKGVSSIPYHCSAPNWNW